MVMGWEINVKKNFMYLLQIAINKIKIGASSFYKRRDSNNFIETVNKIKISTLKKAEKYNIETLIYYVWMYKDMS